MNDYVYLRGEVAQIAGMPRGPDDDVRMRTVRGTRAAFFDTTPAGHALNTPIYKVELHPPGRTFPPNGMPVFRLHYRNDDGGTSYGKDSRVFFTAPRTGDYVVRIADVRGAGSDRHAYRLTIRPQKPDYRLSLQTEHPNLPAGAAIPLDVTVERLDGFEGEIAVRLDGLPEGFSATPAVIEAGETNATLMLSASVEAKTVESAPLRLIAQAKDGGKELARTFPLAGGRSRITVLPKPDLTVTTVQKSITMLPGGEQHVEASITRQNGFAGRVPIELRNLPFGVRVLDVGLNGVLITEAESARRFTILCEPWVKPQRRVIYCTVRTETESPASTEVAATPLVLEIRPGPGKL